MFSFSALNFPTSQLSDFDKKTMETAFSSRCTRYAFMLCFGFVIIPGTGGSIGVGVGVVVFAAQRDLSGMINPQEYTSKCEICMRIRIEMHICMGDALAIMVDISQNGSPNHQSFCEKYRVAVQNIPSEP